MLRSGLVKKTPICDERVKENIIITSYPASQPSQLDQMPSKREGLLFFASRSSQILPSFCAKPSQAKPANPSHPFDTKKVCTTGWANLSVPELQANIGLTEV